MKKYIISLTILAFIFSLSLLTHRSSADTSNIAKLSGYAWSENIGWISFNSRIGNNETGGGGPYAVSVNTDTGDFSGYAWSENIGWIDFNDASMNLTTGEVSGTVKACAGALDGMCGSGYRTDGWDGLIELSGANHTSPNFDGPSRTSTKGVTYNPITKVFSGWAWGSDVVGWVHFNPNISLPVTLNSSNDLKFFVKKSGEDDDEYGTITNVMVGENITLKWITEDLNGCTAVGNDWDSLSNGTTVKALVQGTQSDDTEIINTSFNSASSEGFNKELTISCTLPISVQRTVHIKVNSVSGGRCTNIPAHSTACSITPPSSDTPSTLVQTCSSPSVVCEYSCPAPNYIYSNGACVPKSTIGEF